MERACKHAQNCWIGSLKSSPSGVNCTSPELIESLVSQLEQATHKPILVYPNSGEQWDAVHRCWQGDGQVQEFGELARRWRGAGAQWIGGCCRTGPEHVRAVAGAWRGWRVGENPDSVPQGRLNVAQDDSPG